ncbi:MAG TPA: HAMP domain-containing sensor histidine kinase, partial [Candidatus Saccharimonadia bacterium]
YRQQVTNLGHHLDAIEHYTATAETAAQARQLRPRVAGLLSEQNRILALYSSGDAAGATAAIDDGTETAYMSEVVSLADAIQRGDIAQLEADQRRINLLAKASRDVSLASLGITLLLAILVYYLYLKGIQSERRLDRAKDEFVSLASHQLRTPATGVKSILATLVSGDLGELSPRQLHFAHKALESNDRGLAVIEELLNVAKADAGRLVLNPTTFDAAELVRAVVADQQAGLAAKQLNLQVDLPAQPVTVTADHEKLYMALGNLLDNASKYTPAGGSVEVGLTNRRGSVRLAVGDNGSGIAKAELPLIFDRFGRSASAENAHIEGTGLGLYLVGRVVELHRGRIKVTSRLGKGTKFVMIIPKRKSVSV